MIKIATIEDHPALLAMAMRFVEHAPYKKFMTEEKISQLLYNMIIDGGVNSIVLMADDVGMLAGTTTQFVYGTAKQAVELAWWVEPSARKTSAGLELVKNFEAWATSIGCEIMVMGCIDEKVATIYEKNGYALYERSYFKELK